MVGAAAVHLGMRQEEVGAAMELVLPLWENRLSAAAPKRELWRYGISGDLPILCCEGNAPDSEKLLRRFCLLKSCGLNADLVYFSDEQGEYQQPLRERLGRHLERTGTSQTTGCPRHPFPSWNSAPLPRPRQRQSQPFPSSLKAEQGVKLSVSHGWGERGGGN